MDINDGFHQKHELAPKVQIWGQLAMQWAAVEGGLKMPGQGGGRAR